MTRWAAFAGVTLAILVLLLLLARASQSVVSDGVPTTERDQRRHLDCVPDGADHLDVAGAAQAGAVDRLGASRQTEPVGRPAGPKPSTLSLLGNVAASHGLFALLLVAGIWLTGVPLSALGIAGDPLSTGWLAVAVGLGVGVALAVANTVVAGMARTFGADPSEDLRELLAPESVAGWVLLLGVVLPVIAGFEELLFRAALVGAFSVGFELSPWLLAVVSSVAFAAGHGAQGGLGVVVTGALGLVLAAVFIVTNSLLVVVVAHYVVNAAEFVVVEGLGVDPLGD